MNEIYFEKIEAYLNDEMSSEERKSFELEIDSNEELSSAFRIYKTVETEGRNIEKNRSAEIALKNTLHTLNKTHFSNDNKASGKIVSISGFKFYKMAAAVAASVIIVFAGYFLFLHKPGPQQLAINYTKENYTTLHYTMSGSSDTLQVGLFAYNKKEYHKALDIFIHQYHSNPSYTDVAKYIGIIYLVTNDYENALRYFDLLSKKNLFSNPGKFLKAITLLERNKSGDKEQAKILLQQVVQEKAEGSEEAEKWLKEF